MRKDINHCVIPAWECKWNLSHWKVVIHHGNQKKQESVLFTNPSTGCTWISIFRDNVMIFSGMHGTILIYYTEKKYYKVMKPALWSYRVKLHLFLCSKHKKLFYSSIEFIVRVDPMHPQCTDKITSRKLEMDSYNGETLFCVPEGTLDLPWAVN